MDFRFLTETEVVDLLNPTLAKHGWAQLNGATSRVLGAFDAGRLVEVMVLQLHPIIGPMVKVDEGYNDGGRTSRELTQRMEEYLRENDARGWLVIADTPFTERLCERHGMHRLESPVFISTRPSPPHVN